MILCTDVLVIPEFPPGSWYIYGVQYGALQRYQLWFQNSIIKSLGGRDQAISPSEERFPDSSFTASLENAGLK